MGRTQHIHEDRAVTNAREILSQVAFGDDVDWIDGGWEHVRALAVAGAALGSPEEEIAALAACAVVVAENGGADVACDLLDIAWSLLTQMDDEPLAQEHEVQLRATRRAVQATAPYHARRRAKRGVRANGAVRRIA
jgi:hypothetical protein